MSNNKIEQNSGYKLYGSAVTDSRNKTASLYNKRPTYNVPDLQYNNNYLSPNYTPTDRSSKWQEANSRLAVSYVGKVDFNPPTSRNTYENYTAGRGSYTVDEPKSASRAPSSSGKQAFNENDNLSSVLGKKRCEVETKKQSLNQNTDNYRKIMQKLNKKQKIIHELQKLCETKVSDGMRYPGTYQKGDYQVYSPVRKSKNTTTNSSGFTLTPVPQEVNNKLNVPTVYNTALTQSLNFDVNRKEFQSTFLGSPEESSPVRKGRGSYVEKQIRKVEDEGASHVRKGSYAGYEIKKTEDQCSSPIRKGSYVDREKSRAETNKSKDSYRNISTAYNTPKQSSRGSQEFDYLKDKTKVQAGKKYNMFDVFGNDSYKPKDMTLSSKLAIPETTNISEIYTRKSRQFEEKKEQKPMKDIRQMLESKNIKNNSGYFSGNKKISIYDFQLKKMLGEGKFGQVYQAFHKDTSSLYALKKISKKVIKSSMMVDQLLQQIKIQAYCTHENILKLYGFFDDTEFIYIILEYMEEGTLFCNLKQQKTLKQDDVKLKIKDIAKAVVYLHEQGIAHRDIKPENIVMSNNVCKLCDFGWAAICTDRRKTYCGTFDYVAPQILEGSQYDVSVDLWCLGVLAYELLVGKAPFYHISRKQTMKKIMNVQKLQFPANVSQNARSFIESLIKKNPEERLNGQDILKHPFLASADQGSN